MKRLVSILIIVFAFGTISVAQVRYLSINKDVHNGTGQEAHGLKIVIKGQLTVVQRFDGIEDENHFGNFNEDYDGVNNETILWWYDPRGENDEPRPIPHCEWVHIGFRLNLPGEILETYWTDENGDQIGNIIPQPYQEIIFDPDDTNLQLKITNSLRNGSPVSFELAGYAIVEQEIPLNELNAANPLFNNLTPFAGASGNIQLTSGSSRSFNIPRNTDENKPETWAIYLKRGKDGGDTVVYRDFGQYGPVPPVPPPNPTVSQWGLIIMAVVLAAVGAIAIRKRRFVAS